MLKTQICVTRPQCVKITMYDYERLNVKKNSRYALYVSKSHLHFKTVLLAHILFYFDPLVVEFNHNVRVSNFDQIVIRPE